MIPTLIEPIIVPKIWGGQSLASFYNIPTKEPIGEAWLFSSVPGKSSQLPLGLNGSLPLVKLLESLEPISVQVHPSDALALKLEGYPTGKAEAWYILEAAPSAVIYHGLKISVKDFFKRLNKGSFIPEECMNSFTPKPGDIIPIPPGIMHATKGHMIWLEVQQPSDFTYRCYDWGRDRRLDLKKSRLAVSTQYQLNKPLRAVSLDSQRDLLCACQHFAIEELRSKACVISQKNEILVPIDSSIMINDMIVPRFCAAFIPSGIKYNIGDSRVLRTYVPEDLNFNSNYLF